MTFAEAIKSRRRQLEYDTASSIEPEEMYYDSDECDTPVEQQVQPASWSPASLEALVHDIDIIVSGNGLPPLPPLTAEERQGLSAIEQRRLYRVKQNQVRCRVVPGQQCTSP